jgi:hypothetical protein
MLRREPTAIPITESDIEDVKLMAQKRKEAREIASSGESLLGKPDIPPHRIASQNTMAAIEKARLERETKEREVRLGLK